MVAGVYWYRLELVVVVEKVSYFTMEVFTCVLSVAVAKRGPYHVTRVPMQIDARNAHAAARRKTSEISLFVCCSHRRIGDGLSHSVRAVVVVEVVDEIGRETERQRERDKERVLLSIRGSLSRDLTHRSL